MRLDTLRPARRLVNENAESNENIFKQAEAHGVRPHGTLRALSLPHRCWRGTVPQMADRADPRGAWLVCPGSKVSSDASVHAGPTTRWTSGWLVPY